MAPTTPLALLTHEQCGAILASFEQESTADAHTAVWCRRQYAPMHIHTPEFASLREQILRALPGYTIAFDVVFESAGGFVGWHCDYESIGPFEVPNAWMAIRNAHFVSVHFTITDGGGALLTLPWPRLSWFFCAVIARAGIYGIVHRMMNAIWWPVFWCAATRHSNAPRAGNPFDNMRLHAVASGRPRVSYVVRLARTGHVGVSRRSIRNGIERSATCGAYRFLIDAVRSDGIQDVGTLNWSRV